MLFFKNFITKMLSPYLNSYKFKNYFTSTLRFFFEKSNKNNPAFDDLGYTSRGAKWLDLRVQNVKTLLTSQYKLVIMGVIFCLFLLIFVKNPIRTAFYSEYWIYVLSLKWCLTDIIFTLISIILYIASRFKSELSQTINKWYSNEVKQVTNQNKFKVIKVPSYENHVKVYYNLLELRKQENTTRRLLNFKESLKDRSYLHSSGSYELDVLLVSFRKSNNLRKSSSIQLSNYDTYLVSDVLGFDKYSTIYSTTTSLGKLSKGLPNYDSQSLKSLNSTLSTTKSDRWVTKNTLVDRKLSVSNTAYKLANLDINELSYLSNLSKPNLWTSMFYSKNNLKLSNFNTTALNPFFYNNLSHLDDSRGFIQKRAVYLTHFKNLNKTFTTQLDLNLSNSVEFDKNSTVLPVLTSKSYALLNNQLLSDYLTSVENLALVKTEFTINNDRNLYWLSQYKDYICFFTLINQQASKHTNAPYL